MKTKIVIIGPKVHDVGYKPFLISLADDCDIERFGAKNDVVDGEQVVIARLEADDDQLKEFMEAVKAKKPKGAQVSSIKAEKFEGRVPDITRTSMMNMNAQLAKGIGALERIDEKQDRMIGKQDAAIKNQCEMLQEIKAL